MNSPGRPNFFWGAGEQMEAEEKSEKRTKERHSFRSEMDEKVWENEKWLEKDQLEIKRKKSKQK